MNKKWLIAPLIALIASALAGCASMPDMGAPNVTPLIRTAQPAQLGDAGLAGTPETVFIPARYRRADEGALYIDGRQFVTPDGYSDVAGFLPMAGGSDYLVAVRQQTLEHGTEAGATGSNNPFVVYYRVSASGEVQTRIGVIADANDVLVGTNAIYVERKTSATAPGYYSYAGYTTTGDAIGGPQGVVAAAPADNGGWYIARYEGENLRQYKIGFYYQPASGTSVRLGRQKWNMNTFSAMVPTTALFVNRPPVAYTVRCDCWLELKPDFSKFTPSNRDTEYILYALSMGTTQNALQAHKLALLGMRATLTPGSAWSLATRIAVLPNRFGMQFGTQGYGGLRWGFVRPVEGGTKGFNEAFDQYATETGTPVFELASGWGNFFRNLTKYNNSAMSTDSLNDVYAIFTPSGATIVLTNDMAEDGTNRVPLAYVVDGGLKLPRSQIQPLLRRYGMTR